MADKMDDQPEDNQATPSNERESLSSSARASAGGVSLAVETFNVGGSNESAEVFAVPFELKGDLSRGDERWYIAKHGVSTQFRFKIEVTNAVNVDPNVPADSVKKGIVMEVFEPDKSSADELRAGVHGIVLQVAGLPIVGSSVSYGGDGRSGVQTLSGNAPNVGDNYGLLYKVWLKDADSVSYKLTNVAP